MADAAEDAHFVGLELHAGATPVAESAPGEIDADVVPGDRDVGGRPSMIPISASPWDSPAVSHLNIPPIL